MSRKKKHPHVVLIQIALKRASEPVFRQMRVEDADDCKKILRAHIVWYSTRGGQIGPYHHAQCYFQVRPLVGDEAVNIAQSAVVRFHPRRHKHRVVTTPT